MSRPPLSLRLYRAVTGLLEPLAGALLGGRARRGKEDPARMAERLGRAGAPRPEGRLVWLHGASVGETLSLLPLVQALHAADPALTLLVTSGTRASAELLAQRLPPGALHQFVPLDIPGASARFLDHWRPDLAVFVESEVWPNLLDTLRLRDIPAALLSARLSASSLKGWTRARGMARALFSGFALVMAQDDETAAALAAFGARDDGRLNLKLAGSPLPVDEEALEETHAAAWGRPILLAASTHEGEEAVVLDAYERLRGRPDRPLLVIVPRHPDRGPAIAELARGRGFSVNRQGAAERFDGDAEIHVADGLGELGLWYRLSAAALVGGSLLPGLAGHNPIEAARLNVPILTGAHVDKWRGVYAELAQADAFVPVTPETLAGAFAAALDDTETTQARVERARALADRDADVAPVAARLLALVR